jgi:hypothetical protein
MSLSSISSIIKSTTSGLPILSPAFSSVYLLTDVLYPVIFFNVTQKLLANSGCVCISFGLRVIVRPLLSGSKRKHLYASLNFIFNVEFAENFSSMVLVLLLLFGAALPETPLGPLGPDSPDGPD